MGAIHPSWAGRHSVVVTSDIPDQQHLAIPLIFLVSRIHNVSENIASQLKQIGTLCEFDNSGIKINCERLERRFCI